MPDTAHTAAESYSEDSHLLAVGSAPVAASTAPQVIEPVAEAAVLPHQGLRALPRNLCAKAALVLLVAAGVSSGAALALSRRAPWVGSGLGRVSVEEAFVGRAETPQPRPQVIKKFVPHAGYTGPLKVKGKMKIRTTPVAPFTQKLEWHLSGVDPKCGVTNITGIKGACGIHIHEGTDCSKDTAGHYYTGDHDPWGVIHYTSKNGRANLGGKKDPSGIVNVVTGHSADAINGHTVAVHDSTGAKVACGLIRYKQRAR